MNKWSVIFLISGSLLSTIAEARIYQYVDEKGRKVFVDSLAKVPSEYRDQLVSKEVRIKKLTPEQQRDLEIERQKNKYKYEIRIRRDKIHEAMAGSVTEFDFKHNRILVPVKVQYGSRSKTLSLVMDTGASMTVIHRSALTGLGASLLPGNSARVADGSIVKTKRVRLDQVNIGPFHSKNVTASVIDFKGGSDGDQGLLGMDFLYNVRYELDRKNKRIIWEPEKYQELQQQLQDLNELEAQMNAPPVSDEN